MRLRGALGALRSRNSYRLAFLLALFVICTVLYYFGELVDLAGWEALRWDFFYTVHDIHRLFFLAPVISAGYFFRIKGAVIVAIASLIVFLPRGILVSPFPDAIWRAVLFSIIAGALGVLTGVMRNQSEQRSRLRIGALVTNESELGIPERRKDEVLAAGDLEVDLSRHLVKRRGQRVKLTPTEYKLLAFLVSHRGRIVNHTELLRNVWGPEYGKESEYLRVYIGRLRHKIEGDPSNPRFIVTEPGNGYCFVEPE